MSQYVQRGCVLRCLIETASRLRCSQISLWRNLGCCCWSRWKLEVVNYGKVVDDHARLLLGLYSKRVKTTALVSLLGLAKYWGPTRSEGVLPIKYGMRTVALRAALITWATVADVVAILQNQMRGWHILYSVRLDDTLCGMVWESGHRGRLLEVLLLLLQLLLFTSFHYQFFEIKLAILGRGSRTLELMKVIMNRLCTSGYDWRRNCEMRKWRWRLWQTGWCYKAYRGWLEYTGHETLCLI